MGAKIPPMLGRENIMQRLCNNLTKSTPSHISVVGPRFVGKSVLLKALDERMRGKGSPYCAVIFWDLGHQTPRSDEKFMKLLCQLLGEGIKAANNDYGEHLLSVDSGEYAEICEVMDALHDDGQKVLMLWDGFDKPLSGGALTRNLWDNLLELCRKPSFRLVTSTRKGLHQLIRDEKSVTSDFWGVFEGIVRVTSFDDSDVESILATLSELEFKPGARTELINWSAGFPPLFLGVLNQIVTDIPGGQVDNETVNRAAKKALENLSDVISAMWQDCPAAAQDLYIHLVDHGDQPFNDAGKDERDCLIEKGFSRKSGNKLAASCRMLQEYIQGARPDAGSMARLFGSWDDYQDNIRSLLEHRLNHISRFDDRLHRLVARAIEDIPDFPDDCLNNLTGIRDSALQIIWQREFAPEMRVPQNLVSYWTENPRSNHRLISDMMQSKNWRISDDPLNQIRLLGLLTGCHRDFDAKAKVTTKDTYVLIDAIHNFRNRSQHPDGQSIHLGVAVAAIMACLELLACLDRPSPAHPSRPGHQD